MGIKETIEQHLKEVSDQFEAAEKRRKALQQEVQNLIVEEFRLQGRHESLSKLMDDLKKED